MGEERGAGSEETSRVILSGAKNLERGQAGFLAALGMTAS
jgi:hypothetical protein